MLLLIVLLLLSIFGIPWPEEPRRVYKTGRVLDTWPRSLFFVDVSRRPQLWPWRISDRPVGPNAHGVDGLGWFLSDPRVRKTFELWHNPPKPVPTVILRRTIEKRPPQAIIGPMWMPHGSALPRF